MLDKMSDASRIVDRLVQKGLVSRCTSNKDRRAVDISISDLGLETLSKMDAEFKPQEILKNNLTEEEAAKLSELLDKLRG
jgi:DNA-binding MarR family transcriptional regulator